MGCLKLEYYENQQCFTKPTATNHMGGVDRVSTQYDFRGNPLKTLQESSWIDADDDEGSITLLTTFEYDDLKRPVAVKLKINNQPEVIVSQTEYDELLRVRKKTLYGGAEEAIYYAYNIQNWLTKIESPLFTETLQYEQPQGNMAAQWNGNISSMSWQTSRKTERLYSFTYDGVNRLTGTQFAKGSSGSWGSPYTETLTYDKNGNVKTLQRYDASALIDNLVYTHHGNQITSVTDNGTASGLPAGTRNFQYNWNGSLYSDGNVLYTSYDNILNLPTYISLSGNRVIRNTYAADGRKLYTDVRERNVLQDGTRYYNGNLVFDKNKELDYILFDEGRILHENGNFAFEYHLKDHLGSVRVAFTAANNTKTVVQENAYYPFGATIGDLSYAAPLNNNRYGYTGQEQLNDFDLNWYDYIARNYNPLIGRFNSIDPLAEEYYGISPYAYCANNPVNAVDPDGKLPVFLIPLAKGALGAIVDAAAQVTVSMANGQGFGEAMLNIDYTSVGASFVTSALTMPGMSTTAKVTTAAVIGLDAAIDISSSKGVETVVTGEKSIVNAGIDIASSVLPGKTVDGITSGFNKAVTSDLTATSAATMTKETKSGLKQAQSIVNSNSFQTGANTIGDFVGGLAGGQAKTSMGNSGKNSKPVSTNSSFNRFVQPTDAINVQKPLYPFIQR